MHDCEPSRNVQEPGFEHDTKLQRLRVGVADANLTDAAPLQGPAASQAEQNARNDAQFAECGASTADPLGSPMNFCFYRCFKYLKSLFLYAFDVLFLHWRLELFPVGEHHARFSVAERSVAGELAATQMQFVYFLVQ